MLKMLRRKIATAQNREVVMRAWCRTVDRINAEMDTNYTLMFSRSVQGTPEDRAGANRWIEKLERLLHTADLLEKRGRERGYWI